jgi:hypothetical protein
MQRSCGLIKTSAGTLGLWLESYQEIKNFNLPFDQLQT